jgi:hypothetical protein
MGLEVLQRSSTANLIALATVRLRLLGDATDATQDAILAELIASASDAMQQYARPMGRQQYRWTTGGHERQRLILPRCPIDADSVTAEELDEPEDAAGSGTVIEDIVVADAAAGILFLQDGWPGWLAGYAQAPEPLLVVTFRGGYILPDQISTWATSQTWVAGAWVRPTSPALSRWLFEVTTGGADGGTEPTWSTADETGDTISDGAATLTARDAVELPRAASDHCYREIVARYESLQVSSAIKRIKGGSFELERFASVAPAGDQGLQASTRAWLDSMFYGVAA